MESRIRPLAAGLGVAGAALAFAGSWIPSLWGDEVTSILSAERPLPSLFRMLGQVDAVHGAYYVFLHFWVLVFGASPISVRAPSALATGLTVAGVTLLANRLGGMRAAIVAGVICAVLPRLTYAGQEARGYAFSATLAVWVTLLLVTLVLAPETRGIRTRRLLWALYAIGIAGCAYVFLFSLLLVPAHLAFALRRRDRRLIGRWLLAVAVGMTLAIPVLIVGFAERGQIGFLAARTAATFGSVTYGQWFGNPICAALCWTLVAAAIGVAVARHRADDSSLPLLAAVWLLLPPIVLLSVNFVDPIYSSRYLTFAAPAFALLVGHLATRIRRAWIGAAVSVAIAATAAPSYLAQRGPYSENASDWAVDAAYIHSHASVGDAILFDETINPSKRPRLAMRGYPDDFAGLKDVALKQPWSVTSYWADSVYPLAQVPGRLDGIQTAWLIEYRTAGGAADDYGISTLASLGYSVVHTTQEHSSVILELRRG